MGELRSDLPSDIREKADAELTSQVNRAFDELIETARKLSQHRLLVNAGGATAILAFIGSSPNALFAFVPLMCFLVGVIASGLGLHFLLKSLEALHRDALSRRSDFAADRLPLAKAMPSADIGSRDGRLSGWSRVIAQTVFPLAVILGICAFLWSGAACGADDPNRMEERVPAQGLLWQVESGTATVYMLGVIHVGNDRFYPLSPAIESAFARAAVLVQEMKSDPNSQLLLHKMIFEVGVYPPGEGLEQHLSADVLALYQDYLRKASVDPNMLTRFRPWVAAWMISMNEARRLGYNYNRGVATYLRQRAEGDQKEILGLETPADYAELFKALSEETQEVLLRMTLTQVDTFPETMERMIDLWRKGDARAAEKMVQELPDVSSLLPILGGDRNRRMTAKIEEYLQTERTYFVTVGAGHLVGKDGLVDRLRRRGHAVQWLGPEEYAVPDGPN